MITLNHKERLEKTLAGERPDKVPISFWRHFPVDDQTPQGLARAVIRFQEIYDFDFVKVTPASSFCLYDHGVRDEWRGNPEGTREYVTQFIETVQDRKIIKVLDPRKGKLGEQLECLNLIREALPNKTPFIQTIFSPLAQLKNIVGRSNLSYFLRCYPEEMVEVLKVLTDTTILFIEECKKTNIDGIFYAIQNASYDQLSESEYQTLGKPFDLEILSHVSDLWLNLMHIHGSHIMFDLVIDYPCQIINWHDRETSPSLHEALLKTKRVVCGGLRRIETMVLGNPKEIRDEISNAYEQTNGLRWILSTGCVLMLTTPQGNIEAAIEQLASLSH
jgi:uroporphyrinogen decarboxylase